VEQEEEEVEFEATTPYPLGDMGVEPEEEEREVEVATPDPPGDTGTEPEEEEVEVDVATPIPLGDVDVSHGEREADLGVTAPVSPRDAGAEGTVVGDERESDENEGDGPEAVGEVDDDVTLMGTDEHVEPEVSLRKPSTIPLGGMEDPDAHDVDFRPEDARPRAVSADPFFFNVHAQSSGDHASVTLQDGPRGSPVGDTATLPATRATQEDRTLARRSLINADPTTIPGGSATPRKPMRLARPYRMGRRALPTEAPLPFPPREPRTR